jgi:hypothetical protein
MINCISDAGSHWKTCTTTVWRGHMDKYYYYLNCARFDYEPRCIWRKEKFDKDTKAVTRWKKIINQQDGKYRKDETMVERRHTFTYSSIFTYSFDIGHISYVHAHTLPSRSVPKKMEHVNLPRLTSGILSFWMILNI